MTTGSLSKTQAVLHRADAEYNTYVKFTYQNDEPEPEIRVNVLLLDSDLHKEMGEPDTITVTVEPGDKLNA